MWKNCSPAFLDHTTYNNNSFVQSRQVDTAWSVLHYIMNFFLWNPGSDIDQDHLGGQNCDFKLHSCDVVSMQHDISIDLTAQMNIY